MPLGEPTAETTTILRLFPPGEPIHAPAVLAALGTGTRPRRSPARVQLAVIEPDDQAGAELPPARVEPAGAPDQAAAELVPVELVPAPIETDQAAAKWVPVELVPAPIETDQAAAKWAGFVPASTGPSWGRTSGPRSAAWARQG